MSTILERYHESTARLDALIEGKPSPVDSSREAIQARAAIRMNRVQRFLACLGNPHQGYPIVHIGGTSGKGSTSTTIAAILRAAGYRTGLHTSPYLQTPSEKLQIDGRFVEPERYSSLIDVLLDEHARWLARGEDPLTYGEVWFALTALFFRDAHVDVAVLEVGAGGRFDLTNIVQPNLSIVTSVGIDHTNMLGSTIPDIAWHKAGIIKHRIPALSAVHNREARAIIEAEARAMDAPLTLIDPVATNQRITTDPTGTSWTDARSGDEHRIGLRGRFQSWNGATAIAASRLMREQGFAIDDAAIDKGLIDARIPGRAEAITTDRVPVLLDGAHNADKVEALTQDVPALLPSTGRRIAVVGVLEAKQATAMIRQLIPVIDELIATSPYVLAKESKLAEEVETEARAAGFTGRIQVVPVALDALDTALAIADPARGDVVLVTGSLYLVGNVRERWYRTDDMVIQRTAWPDPKSSRPSSPSTLTVSDR